jgi:integrase
VSSKPQRGSAVAGEAAGGGGPATAGLARLETSVVTVGEFWEKYRNLILGERIAELTARNYDSAWRLRVAPTFADRDLGSVNVLDVELAFASWSGGYSVRVDALAALSAMYRVAVKGGFVRSNPCVGIDRPRIQAPDPTSRALNIEQIEVLLAELPKGPYRRFVLAMLYTGCRVGEIAGLRVSDIDWETRTIGIVRTASPGRHGQQRVGPAKGRRGRAVPLAEPLAPILREAVEGKGPHELVFPGPRGGTLSSKNLSRGIGWKRIRDLIKTFAPGEPPLHWHDLRHTAAVMLFRVGVAAPDVQAILGHSSLAVTQMYANTRDDAAERGSAALSAYFAQSLGQLEGGEKAAKTASDLDI